MIAHACVTEVSSFLEAHPYILTDYEHRTWIQIVKTKVFNERKHRREREQLQLKKMSYCELVFTTFRLAVSCFITLL